MRAVLVLLLLILLAVSAHALTVALPPDIDHTALHKAAEACSEGDARAALEALPAAERAAGLDRIDRDGYAPLAYAAGRGCMPVAKLYVEAGANVNASDPRWGWTPLHHAAQARQAHAVRYLLSKGADVNAATAQGKTPWTEAVHGSVFNRSEGDKLQTLQALLESGADVAAGDEPLRRAIRESAVRNEQMARDIERLQDENLRLRQTIDEIRSRLGGDEVRPLSA